MQATFTKLLMTAVAGRTQVREEETNDVNVITIVEDGQMSGAEGATFRFLGAPGLSDRICD